MKMYFAAIDLGATYIKSARIDARTFELQNIKRERFPAFDDGPFREVRFTDIMTVVRRVLDQQNGPECRGLLFSNQMHGLVLLLHGRVVSPFISWQDPRSEKYLPNLRKKLPSFEFHRETGEFLRAGFPVTTLFALKEEGLSHGTVCDLGSAVVQQLTGAPAVMDITNAAAIGAWDIRGKEWHWPMIQALGLDGFTWPTVSAADKVVGQLDRKATAVYPSVGDQQVSLLGAGLSAAHQVCFNVATGSQVSFLSDDISMGDHQLRPYFGGRWLKTITHIPAGRALNKLVRLFAELNPQMDLEQAWDILGPKIDNDLQDVPDIRMNLSFFSSGIGSEGSVTHIRENQMNVTAWMRSALNSVAQSHIEAMARLNISPADHLSYLGAGGILRKSAYLQHAFARLLGKPIRLEKSGEDALLGHARRAEAL